VQRLARLREPWHVISADDGIAVCDANGVLLVRLSRGGDAEAARRRNDDQLSEAEAAELARLIALLPVLSRRPQY
jgi:hypothetical protein